jgi:hypothetical protein
MKIQGRNNFAASEVMAPAVVNLIMCVLHAYKNYELD